MLILRVLQSGPCTAMRSRSASASFRRVLEAEEGSLYPALQRILIEGWAAANGVHRETGRRVRFTSDAGRHEQLKRELNDTGRRPRPSRRFSGWREVIMGKLLRTCLSSAAPAAARTRTSGRDGGHREMMPAERRSNLEARSDWGKNRARRGPGFGSKSFGRIYLWRRVLAPRAGFYARRGRGTRARRRRESGRISDF